MTGPGEGPRPRDLDRLAEEQGVTLKDLVRAIPPECWKIEPLEAWGGLLRNRNLAIVAVLQVLLTCVTFRPDDWTLAYTIPAAVTLWCLTAWAFGGVFLIGHDCGHTMVPLSRVREPAARPAPEPEPELTV